MSYERGPERSEVQLLPACLDDYVGPESAARFLEAYVEGLDFQKLGFKHARPKETGRPPYHPADLLKLYLYGYLNRIRSSRRLEAEAGRNLELMWLMRRVRPDFKTIADFRKDNLSAFKMLFKDFNLLCRKMGLFGAELVAIDGSKFKAINNTRRNYNSKQLEQLTQQIQERIDEYLKDLEQQDKASEQVPPAPTGPELAEKIARLKERQERYRNYQEQLEQSGQKEISLSDADGRKMKGAHGEHLIGYNVQVAVDARHDLIAVPEVVQSACDRGQLARIAQAAKEELGAGKLQAVTDKGYHHTGDLESCEKAGIETYVPAPGTTSGRGKNGQAIFPKEQFRYQAGADVYHCPAGEVLGRRRQNGDRIDYYNPKACQHCALRRQCTTGNFRLIGRLVNQPAAERTAQRVAQRPDLVSRRKEIVEHVFGALRNWHHDRFLMKGLEKVKAEFNLSALTYNLRRVLSLVSLEEFRKAC